MKEGREGGGRKGGREEGRKGGKKEGEKEGGGQGRVNEVKTRRYETCRNVCIYPPAASVHHCSLPSPVQRKPRGIIVTQQEMTSS